MTLQFEIEQLQTEMLKTIPQDVLMQISKNTTDLIATGIEGRALKVGDTFPAFELNSNSGELVSSVELLMSGPLVINFYRGGW